MECLIVSMILVVATISLLLVAISSRRGGGWSEAFHDVARRFHGVAQAGGWFREPSVWMRHGAAQGRLTLLRLRGSGGERCLQMTIQQAEVTARCEIFHRESRPALLPLPRGLMPIEFDWGESRHQWRVLAADGDAIAHLLSDGVRLAIDHLWRRPSPAETTISLSPGWLVVRKVWKWPRGNDLEEFVERVCALADQLNLAAVSGIEFVASDEPQLLDEARCGICGDNLASDIVVCRRCNTPHHRECWQYGGGCATYGCGGRECVAPAIAPMVKPR